jgi:YHS domain-containing protein
MTKDPVCGTNVDENKAQYQSQYGGQKYNFCSEPCKKEFDRQPEAVCSVGRLDQFAIEKALAPARAFLCATLLAVG